MQLRFSWRSATTLLTAWIGIWGVCSSYLLNSVKCFYIDVPSIFLILLFCTNPLDSSWPIIYVWNCILGVLVVQFNLILAGISPDWGGLVSWRSSLLFIQIFQIFSNVFKFFKYSETGLVSWRGRTPAVYSSNKFQPVRGETQSTFCRHTRSGVDSYLQIFQIFCRQT